MFTLLIIVAFIAVCLIYLLQFQIVRDYKPYLFDTGEGYVYICILDRYSIFDWRRIQ